ncbi:UvrD/REP helicase (plasmid) [Legionella adelaidensis]|uniref:DNA 3'-5' helicase n=1 Tax=Legionella adelaidensis TaxID=45056 RepID=A0A0W0R1L9_9GAMM|nr:UvrD-helicase domain-containing protein [Legionella adelaidensis]KTC64949.1 UvrD/REP helicase [Legionella adelaidensis]VEH85632.1 UvrD/REP helicase [Legionella adelaidensis]
MEDKEQRLKATDPAFSFIVQAPAGSGKTEILTQRYLRLLATVKNPEQILALTFTRKAANEMRERILLALRKAEKKEVPQSAHQKMTIEYAQRILELDYRYNWQLLNNPTRLNIFTIDALCQKITSSIPLQEKTLPFANISERPDKQYRLAARACLNYAVENTPYHTAIKTLLLHVDNNQEKLITLFSQLLSHRDQWLSTLYQAKLQQKTDFEKALGLIERHEIARFYASIPTDCHDDLMRLARKMADLQEDNQSPVCLLQGWTSFHNLTQEQITGLARLLLTSQETLRKSFDHHVGLKKANCNPKDYEEIKNDSKYLLTRLEASSEFPGALVRVKDLPEPQFEPKDWQVLQALLQVLPLLTAHLFVAFQKANEIDFIEVAQQAFLALEQDGNPTDLALYWDNQITHLLVDEFQDTSILQFELLERLLQGWGNDERTVFLVGDPMQSIYRFRSAEVGLFLRAKKYGIGPVQPLFLELKTNFRSSSLIVDWINNQFSTIFPSLDDIESGAISYSASYSQKESVSSVCEAYCYENKEQEAAGILNCITKELETYPQSTIAILVRSRNQLVEIIRLLRQAGIPFQGVEIDLLSSLPHLKDIWIFTQALLYPTNRLIWLSLLRSPWVGMSLFDLHCIANFDKQKSIYFALENAHAIQGLSQEGILRAQFLFQTFQQAFCYRYQKNCIAWIEETLNHLHLQKILSPSERNDIEQFWLLLEKFINKGQLEDLEGFQQAFNSLYSKKVTLSRLQVMTIHKSKGLEFDCVILPGLSAKMQNRDRPLMRWLKLPHEEKELLLLSPVKSSEEDNSLLYDYIGKLEEQKNTYETQRLLYVAVTRAKSRLYLFDYQEKESAGSFRHLLKKQPFQSSSVETVGVSTEVTHKHLPIEWYSTPPKSPPVQLSQIHLENSAPIPRLFGSATHEILQWICDNHPYSVEEIPWELFQHFLKTAGVSGNLLEEATKSLIQQISNLFHCPIGRWITQAQAEEYNELELLLENNGEMITRIVDRTFINEGKRWVIDFKTGTQTNIEKHKQQVNEYALYLSKLYTEPIHCGLYYLQNNNWVNWEFIRQV